MGRAQGHQAAAAAAVPRRGGRWTEEAILAAFAPVCERLGRWPSKTEIREAGLGPAYHAMNTSGIPTTEWRRKFGLPAEARVGRPPVWTVERAEQALLEFASSRGPDDWPSRDEFNAAGLSYPAQLVDGAHGGLLPFAAAHGYQVGASPRKWDIKTVEAELRTFIANLGELPGRSAFIAAGRDDLWQALDERGGPHEWAARLGLPYAARRRDTKRAELRAAESASRSDRLAVASQMARDHLAERYDTEIAGIAQRILRDASEQGLTDKGLPASWAAGAAAVAGRVNFLFDPALEEQMSTDNLAEAFEVSPSTVGAKENILLEQLDVFVFDPRYLHSSIAAARVTHPQQLAEVGGRAGLDHARGVGVPVDDLNARYPGRVSFLIDDRGAVFVELDGAPANVEDL